MTREEAANWLINIMADIGYEQALSEIRELLEAQPEVIACGSGELIVDATGDLVSRAAAIDDVCKMMYECFGADDEELDAIEVTLRELPAAQPERDIPIKPNETTDTACGIPHRQAVCPKCDYYLGHVVFLGDGKGKKVTYCETCGQAIDWEGWNSDE